MDRKHRADRFRFCLDGMIAGNEQDFLGKHLALIAPVSGNNRLRVTWCEIPKALRNFDKSGAI